MTHYTSTRAYFQEHAVSTAEAPERPAPEVRSTDPPPPELAWPTGMAALEKRAAPAGWQTVRTYARGWKDGRTKGTFELLEIAVVKVQRPGSVRWAFCWERSPESTAKAGPAWKATAALEGDASGNVRTHTHTAARALL